MGDVYLRFGTVQRPWQEQDAERDQGVWIEATQTRESGRHEVIVGTGTKGWVERKRNRFPNNNLDMIPCALSRTTSSPSCVVKK